MEEAGKLVKWDNYGAVVFPASIDPNRKKLKREVLTHESG
jgi:hypothetical protein